MKINASEYIDKADYRVQYLDYEPHQWTVWSRLTVDRLVSVIEDLSVRKIQIRPDGQNTILDLDVD